MIIPRVIPALLLDDDVFVKTERYADPTYVGDPTNVISLFNRFEVDEIVLLDIRATRQGREPSYALISQLAAECWVPLSYGGGITTLDQARRILGLGIEKVVLGTVAAEHPDVVRRIADTFGSQAVVVSVDAKPSGSGYETFVVSGSRPLGIGPAAYARKAEAYGAGEILLNAIAREGTLTGFDLGLIREVTHAVGIPVVASGGAGNRSDLARPIIEAQAAAVAAGSIFVYRGTHRAVLVNFPERSQLEGLFAAPDRGRPHRTMA